MTMTRPATVYLFGNNMEDKARRAYLAARRLGLSVSEIYADRRSRPRLLGLILRALEGTVSVVIADRHDLPGSETVTLFQDAGVTVVYSNPRPAFRRGTQWMK